MPIRLVQATEEAGKEASEMTLLEMEGVRRQYATDRRGVVDVSLRVEPGEVVGLLGANGAGKTTLLRLALGLLEPNAGRIRTLGRDPWREPLPVRARVGYAADRGAESFSATIDEMVELHRGLYPRWDRELARHLLGPLARQGRDRIDRMSQGQARRVMLACAMAHRPELLLLDEPAGGLDPATRRDFLELAIELIGDSGTSIVLSSHHLADVERIASRIVVLHEGATRLDAGLDELSEEYCLASFSWTSSGASAAVGSEDRRATLATIPGFVGCRVRGERVRAVFRAPSEEAEAALRARGFDAACGRSNLEDLFITIVGDQE